MFIKKPITKSDKLKVNLFDFFFIFYIFVHMQFEDEVNFALTDDNDLLKSGIHLSFSSIIIPFVLKGLRRPSNPLAKTDVQLR